ncbi:transcription factor [Asimina triloba]
MPFHFFFLLLLPSQLSPAPQKPDVSNFSRSSTSTSPIPALKLRGPGMEEDEEHARRCKEFIHTLEEERRKIQVFHRELPLTMRIVSRAIDYSRQWLAVESLFLDGSEFKGNSGEVPAEDGYIPASPNLDEEKNEERADQEPRRAADWLRYLYQYDLDVDINSSMLLSEVKN